MNDFPLPSVMYISAYLCIIFKYLFEVIDLVLINWNDCEIFRVVGKLSAWFWSPLGHVFLEIVLLDKGC